MPNLLLVMAGGAIGAGFRYQLSRTAAEQLGTVFPWATLIANLLGGLLMGLLVAICARDGKIDDPLLLFLGTGVLGGFTTFSAFSLETVRMMERGDLTLALAYVVSSVAGAAALLLVGLWAGKATS
jgi:CrcB protein